MSIDQEHWAAALEQGDRVIVTIRHPTDGSKNLLNQKAIVVENYTGIYACRVAIGNDIYQVPYNEMKQHEKT